MAYKPSYRYVPPLSKNWLTPFYDFSCTIVGLGKRFKQKVASAIPLTDGMTIVDVGCGTGMLLEILSKRLPHAKLFGFDPDERALGIARRRLPNVPFEKAFAEQLPLPDASADVVFSTLAFHHMPDEIKKQAAKEIFRILKPGGHVVIADFGPSKSAWITKLFHLFENAEYLRGNLEGFIPTYLKQAGFSNIRTLAKHFPSCLILSAKKA